MTAGVDRLPPEVEQLKQEWAQGRDDWEIEGHPLFEAHREELMPFVEATRRDWREQAEHRVQRAIAGEQARIAKFGDDLRLPRTKDAVLIDRLDRLVRAVERIADTLERQEQ